ncbi:hypothetical protein AB0L71_20830 [Streptomyces sp. NPDC052052]|uniref:hypothetical protein n=1 Tax=Streptomyces sp. NPDC052052 TaxID=3154756 RepID=UPI003448A7A4
MPNRQTSEENTMALRVPKAELPAELRQNLIKQLGLTLGVLVVLYVAVGAGRLLARLSGRASKSRRNTDMLSA